MRWLGHGLIIALLTVVTQIGGIAWLVAALLSRRPGTLLLIFLVAYTALWSGARYLAPTINRIAVPCIDLGPTRARAHSPLYCALNRTYVTPELARHLDALAVHMHDRFPGTRTRVLDASFPFFNLPLLPHLSHDDGEKADLAFWYEGAATRSPIGYWAFEAPRPDDPQPCADNAGPLRWNMTALQPLMRDLALDDARTAEALRWLAANLPPGGKIFIEPHLVRRLGVTSDKIRFQGCRAARHDDHIHLQL